MHDFDFLQLYCGDQVIEYLQKVWNQPKDKKNDERVFNEIANMGKMTLASSKLAEGNVP